MRLVARFVEISPRTADGLRRPTFRSARTATVHLFVARGIGSGLRSYQFSFFVVFRVMRGYSPFEQYCGQSSTASPARNSTAASEYAGTCCMILPTQ